MISELKAVAQALENLVARAELIAARMTETADLYRGLVVNSVLFSGTVVIPASGVWTQSFQAPYAAVAVLNMAATALTVSSGGAMGAAPGGGPGVAQVPPTSFTRRNLSGREISIYGAAGTTVDVEVLVRPVEPQVTSA